MRDSLQERRAQLVAHGYRMSASARLAVDAADRALAETTYAAGPVPAFRRVTELLLAEPTLHRHRSLPSALGEPSASPEGDLRAAPEITWLEPLPDLLAGPALGPGLALHHVAALQRVPAVDRALLSLAEPDPGAGRPGPPRPGRLSLDEVAAVFGCSPESVAAELALAQARISAVDGVAVPGPRLAPDQAEQLLNRWAAAFEDRDVDALASLLTEDAVWEMPPFAAWFRGTEMVTRLIRAACPAQAPGDQLMVPVRANGQPGFALYLRDQPSGTHRAFQVQVLSLTADGVARAVAFFDATLFDAFGLPRLLSDLRDSQPPAVQVPTAVPER